MKRDIGLIKTILLELEKRQESKPSKIKIDGYKDKIVDEHLILLNEAGYIDGTDKTYGSDRFHPSRLTWEGHEFLDAIRDKTRWEKIKEYDKEHKLTFEAIKMFAIALIQAGIKATTGF